MTVPLSCFGGLTVVSVSLLELVRVFNTRRLWPEDFRALVEAAEEEPGDRLRYGAIADWCDEHGEPEYGAAWRWLWSRPVSVCRRQGYGEWPHWSLGDLPKVFDRLTTEACDVTTLAGLVAHLAMMLAELKAHVS